MPVPEAGYFTFRAGGATIPHRLHRLGGGWIFRPRHRGRAQARLPGRARGNRPRGQRFDRGRSTRFHRTGSSPCRHMDYRSVFMIIARAPFRISFGGGGSDLPSYYQKFGGCVLSASINKYIYLDIHPFFEEHRIQLKYSRTENVDAPGLIKHPIFRCVLDRFNLSGVELTSTADIPSGTGLGSSSSFTVALLQCVYAYQGAHRSKAALASEACGIEIEEIGSPIGKQ